jgi:hypothetical protein
MDGWEEGSKRNPGRHVQNGACKGEERGESYDVHIVVLIG